MRQWLGCEKGITNMNHMIKKLC